MREEKVSQELTTWLIIFGVLIIGILLTGSAL
jgi:hypothetical protein